jgi:predicted ArsR family transcriptional regulator
MAANWNRRFLVSTRGRILSLLRREAQTVNDLAAALGLTDNAVRAHLATLERDGLVQPGGSRPGSRKPNIVYELTSDAAQVFPKPYGPVLQQLLEVLHECLRPADLEQVLRVVGQRVASSCRHQVSAENFPERLLQVLAVLEELGGLAELEEEGGRLCLRGFDCPLGAAATEHRQVCRIAESLLTDLLGVRVREQCRLGASPQCVFEIAVPRPSKKP